MFPPHNGTALLEGTVRPPVASGADLFHDFIRRYGWHTLEFETRGIVLQPMVDCAVKNQWLVVSGWLSVIGFVVVVIAHLE